MTDATRAAIPVDAYPDPVAAYAAGEGRLDIVATNDAFADAFGGDAATVRDLFDRFCVVETHGGDDAATRVARGDDATVYLGGFDADDAYLVRVAGADDDTGYLVFTAVGDVDDICEGVGVGAVASVLSHDLRNPLDVAKAHLRAAEETGDDEHFDAVAAAHDRMARIIRDVLTLARGDDVVDPSAGVAVADAVADAWQSVDTDDATLDASDDLPTATADPDRVRRLFENLFRNAVEHGSTSPRSHAHEDAAEHGSTSPDSQAHEDGGVTVAVGPLADEDGFYVEDDGPGIPADEREAVLEPGYTTADTGAGLGLAIVNRIAAAHDWDVSVTSSASGGARFEVSF